MILESGILSVGERLRDVLLDMPLGGGIGAVDDGIVRVVSFSVFPSLVFHLLSLQRIILSTRQRRLSARKR